jgi:CO/xanthine dehydrogenase Mo-binding subunit
MREILISQLNVLILLILVCLAGTIKIFSMFSSTDSGDIVPNGITECTVSVNKDTGNSKVEKFPAGTDCEAMRKLEKEGKPLPTIIDVTPSGITDCTVSVNKKTGTSKVAKFPAGTDCDAMRKLEQEGKPLPTIINSPPTTVP